MDNKKCVSNHSSTLKARKDRDEGIEEDRMQFFLTNLDRKS